MKRPPLFFAPPLLIAPLAALALALSPAQAGLVEPTPSATPTATATPATPTPAVVVEEAHPALWQVTRGTSTIYLFGTVHALPKNVAWFAGPVETAFDRSDDLVTEIIEKSPEDMRGIVVSKAMLPNGQTLTGMMRARDRAAFAKAMAGNGLPPASLDRFQPWYAAVALSTLPLMRTGFDPANGVDASLTGRAGKSGHTHEALETPEYQLGLFAGLSKKVQLAYLHQVVHSLPTIADELNGMIKAWKAGDADRLAKIMNADQDSPEMRDLLLIDRNKAWAHWIADRLDHPKAAGEVIFIAVGAGHLAGPGCVQDQLRKVGIRATRVQ